MRWLLSFLAGTDVAVATHITGPLLGQAHESGRLTSASVRQVSIPFVLATLFISSGCWTDRPIQPTHSYEVSSISSASVDCGQGSRGQFDNMAPCSGPGYSTTPVVCYSTVFHVSHDGDRVGTYCHGSGAAYETQLYCAQHPPPDDAHFHLTTTRWGIPRRSASASFSPA